MWKREGIRWQDIADANLRSEAQTRALNAEPDKTADEIWDNHDGTIDVTFGSTGATIMLRSTSYDASGLFGYGYCALLALALHDRTQLPLILFDAQNLDNEDWQGHAAIRIDDANILDIDGVRPHAEVLNEYGNLTPGRVVNRDEFINTVCTIEHRDNPYGFVEPLEQFILHDFAEYLTEQRLPMTAA